MIDLEAGEVSLETCTMLKEDSRVDRLLSLYECHQEVFSPGSATDSKMLKTLVNIRTSEMDEYLKAEQDLTNFMLNFGQVNSILN
jgi:hypothetical protein